MEQILIYRFIRVVRLEPSYNLTLLVIFYLLQTFNQVFKLLQIL
jgi:hypothetical protein